MSSIRENDSLEAESRLSPTWCWFYAVLWLVCAAGGAFQIIVFPLQTPFGLGVTVVGTVILGVGSVFWALVGVRNRLLDELEQL